MSGNVCRDNNSIIAMMFHLPAFHLLELFADLNIGDFELRIRIEAIELCMTNKQTINLAIARLQLHIV